MTHLVALYAPSQGRSINAAIFTLWERYITHNGSGMTTIKIIKKAVYH